MDIFVQSRGRSPDFEYCWQPEVPPQLSSISSLIQSESPSVVLARSRGKLMLLTTGLESSEKKDFRDRPIRHSMFWYCNDNSYDETQIRAIAVQALRGLLSDQVDKHIKLGGENGFEISFSELKNLTESLPSEIESQRLPESEESPQIGKNSQELRDDLAYKLQQYSLPKSYELIVIATGVKSEDALKNAGAWRSLSNLVKSENWRNLSRSEVQQSRFFGVAIAIIVAVIVIIALILLVVLLHPFSPKPEVTPSSPQETTRSEPKVEVNPEQVDQNSSVRDLTSLEKGLQSLEKDLTPSTK
jgi:hypothetical protein